MTLSARHGRVRFLHLMYVCHLSSFSYCPSIYFQSQYSARRFCLYDESANSMPSARVCRPPGCQHLRSGTYFAAKRLERSQGLGDFA
jgi:hypothetical protein